MQPLKIPSTAEDAAQTITQQDNSANDSALESGTESLSVICVDDELEAELRQRGLINEEPTNFIPGEFVASTPMTPFRPSGVATQLIASSRSTGVHAKNPRRNLRFETASSTSSSQNSVEIPIPRRLERDVVPPSGSPTTSAIPSLSTPKRKRKSQSTTSTPSTSRKKKKNSTPGSARRNNDSGIGPIQDEDENSMSSLDIEDENARENVVNQFSIHRLPLDRLHKRFKKRQDQVFSEFQIIEKIMKEINDGYKERPKFEKMFPPGQETDSNSESPSSEEIDPDEGNGFLFQIVAYVQVIIVHDKFLSRLGINMDAGVGHINKIVFYYRAGEIFAITLGPTWKVIQPYSCHDFPCIISGRLTNTEGNVVEINKRVTGIHKMTKSTNKYSILADQLKNVRLNWTKELRNDCSLYKLKEFAFEKSFHTRIQFGLAYIRILRRMSLDTLPEILNHLGKIASGEPTSTLHGREEKQIDDFPQLRVVPPGEETQKLEEHLHKIIYNFMHNSGAHKVSQFDFCDKYIEDFSNLEELKINYDSGGTTNYTIATFDIVPTALQVFSAIRENCPELTNEKKFSTFSNKLKKNLWVEYVVRGRTTETIQRKLLNFLEGEMRVDDYDQDYWKTMGQWCTIRDEYYCNVHKEFLDLLRKPEILRVPSTLVDLTEKWMPSMKNVHEYVEQYELTRGYYLPPTEDEIVAMSSQPMEGLNDDESEDEETRTRNASLLAAAERNRVGAKFIYDLMHIQKLEDGKISISVYYIFDRFDAGVRDASTKIRKSMELLLRDGPTDATASLLEKLYGRYSHGDAYFLALFPNFDEFKQHMNGDNVNIVLAFLTNGKTSEDRVSTPGKITFYCTRPAQNANQSSLSLEREKNLDLHFNEDNVRTEILNGLGDGIVDKICMELEIPLPNSQGYDGNLLASKVLTELLDKGYCVENESVDKPITGKLLKLRNEKSFALFRDKDVNKAIFKRIKENFITLFPGFIQKLECFEIYESVSAITRLKLNLTELAVGGP